MVTLCYDNYMRVLVIGAIVFTLYYLPVYAFNTYVMPELQVLQATYQRGEKLAESISRGE